MNLRLGLIFAAGFILAVSNEVAAQSFALQTQGVYREARQKITQYRTGGIYSLPSMSPYYVLLRGGGSYNGNQPFAQQQIRARMNDRARDLDNRRQLLNQARHGTLTTSISLPRLPSATGNYSPKATGHSTRFMTHR